MKYLLLALVIVGAVAFVGYAETVNPASNVTADTANTNGTIVLRHSTTGVANITLQASAIDTAKIAADAVTTANIMNASVNTAKISTATNDSGKILASCGGLAVWRVGGTCP